MTENEKQDMTENEKQEKLLNAPFLSEDELAAEFGVSRSVIRGLRNKGLPAYKIGVKAFFDADETLAWIKKNCRHVSAAPARRAARSGAEQGGDAK